MSRNQGSNFVEKISSSCLVSHLLIGNLADNNCAGQIFTYNRFRRVEQAVTEKTPVVDIDGSYLYQKYKSLSDSGKTVMFPACPSKPLHGWRAVNKDNYQNIALLLPIVPSGKVKVSGRTSV